MELDNLLGTRLADFTRRCAAWGWEEFAVSELDVESFS